MAALVQSKSQVGTGTLIQAFDSAVTLGNLILVAVAALTSGQTYTVTDSQGNTYSHLASFLASGSAAELQIFYAQANASGANTVTFTPGVSVAASIAIHEFSGVSTTPDVSASAAGTGATQDSGPATTSSADELLFGFTAGSCNAGLSIAAGVGFTLAESLLDPNPLAVSFATEWQLVSSIGAYDATTTASLGKAGTFAWGTEIVSFALSGGTAHSLMMIGIGG
jgi:hypothetical protein